MLSPNKLSLKIRLLIPACFAVFLCSIAMVSIAMYILTSSTMDGTGQALKVLNHSYRNYVGTWLEDRHNAIKSLSKHIDFNDKAEIYDHLQSTHDAMDFTLTFFGTENGAMYRQDPSLDGDAGYDPRKRDWYRSTKAAMKPILSAPYLTKSTNELVIAATAPVMKGSDLVGIVAGTIPLEVITEQLNGIHLPGTGFAVLLYDNRQILSHTTRSNVMKDVSTLAPYLNADLIASINNGTGKDIVDYHGKTKVLMSEQIEGTKLSLLFVTDETEILTDTYILGYKMLGAGILLVLLTGLTLILIFRSQFADIDKLNAALKDIADGDGDLSVQIHSKNEFDEIGTLAGHFNRFVGNLRQMFIGIADNVMDLDKTASDNIDGSIRHKRTLDEQRQEIDQVATAINQMASATEEIAASATRAAADGNQSMTLAADNKKQVAETITSIHQLAENIRHAGDIIGQLDKTSESIGDILAVINGISEQTNLLALNAAIEAARAGEHGRGFAVVADEVRSLSVKTRDSIDQIRTIIDSLQSGAKNAVSAVKTGDDIAQKCVANIQMVDTGLSDIETAIHSISDQLTQVSTAAEEQTLVTSEINRNASNISATSAELADEAERQEATSAVLAEVRDNLQKEVSKYKI